MTGDDRGSQEREERYPVFRICNREPADRRKKEEPEAYHGHSQRNESFQESPACCDYKNPNQVRETRRCGVHPEDAVAHGTDARHNSWAQQDAVPRWLLEHQVLYSTWADR